MMNYNKYIKSKQISERGGAQHDRIELLWDTFKLILKLPVLLCLGIIYSVVGMIRGIYSIFHAFYWVFLTLACNDTMDKYRVSHKINSTLKTYRLDSYFFSYYPKDI